VVNKAQRYGYLPTPLKTLDELRQGLDETLFHSSRYNPHHVLYRLLPRPKDTGHRLRQRAHNLILPSDVGSTARQNFIMRMLFTDMYWSVFLHFKCYCVRFVHCMYFSSFLLCCNASAFVICVIKNYLLTYLLAIPMSDPGSENPGHAYAWKQLHTLARINRRRKLRRICCTAHHS